MSIREYDEIEWNGSETAVIESETDPWIKDPSGVPISFIPPVPGELGPCGEYGHFIPGVLAPINTDEGIETCDSCQLYDSDLRAARALAETFGRGYTVWFHGTNGDTIPDIPEGTPPLEDLPDPITPGADDV